GLFAVAPGQINFQIPPGTAEGMATVTLNRGGQTVAAGSLRVAAVAPGLFTAGSTGRGAPAGLLLKVEASGSRTFSNLFLLDSKNRFLPQPFDPSEVGSQFYLILFGTGIRAARSGVSAIIGTTPLA